MMAAGSTRVSLNERLLTKALITAGRLGRGNDTSG